jgi:hypothetical protein
VPSVEIIQRDRQEGKTTALVREIVDLLDSMRGGTAKREQIAVVAPTHERQVRWVTAIDDEFDRRGRAPTKVDAVYLFNEKSLESSNSRGLRIRKAFVDDAHDFDDDPVWLVQHVWPDADIVLTATPCDNTLLMLEWWEAEGNRRRRRALDEMRRRHRDAQDAEMLLFMLAKIRGEI